MLLQKSVHIACGNNIIVYTTITSLYIIESTSITSLLHHCITISYYTIHLEHGPPHLLCMYGFLLGCLATNPDVDNTSFTVFKWHLQNMAEYVECVWVDVWVGVRVCVDVCVCV